MLAHWANLVNMSIWQSGEMYQSGQARRVAIRSIMQSGQSGILLNMANLAALSIWQSGNYPNLAATHTKTKKHSRNTSDSHQNTARCQIGLGNPSWRTGLANSIRQSGNLEPIWPDCLRPPRLSYYRQRTCIAFKSLSVYCISGCLYVSFFSLQSIYPLTT